MIQIFDHIFSPLKDNNLDATLQRFQRAGFVVDDRKVRHARGRLTGFARLTGTYLEFLSVVDEREFNRHSTREDRYFRTWPQPYGISADTRDAETIYQTIKPNYAEAQPVAVSGSPTDPTRNKIWSICILPRRAFPGTNLFATQYHERKSHAIQVHQGPNSIFALGGFGFCTQRASHYQTLWSSNLSNLNIPVRTEGTTLVSRGQTIEWLTPAEHQARFGQRYNRFHEDMGGIAVVKLLCSDLSLATSYLASEGFRIHIADRSHAYLEPDLNTGFTFELQQGDLTSFLDQYNAATPAYAAA